MFAMNESLSATISAKDSMPSKLLNDKLLS